MPFVAPPTQPNAALVLDAAINRGNIDSNTKMSQVDLSFVLQQRIK